VIRVVRNSYNWKVCHRIKAFSEWEGFLFHSGDNSMTMDVIIPVYKPGRELFELLDRLKDQSVKPGKVILMNTGKEYLDAISGNIDWNHQYPFVHIEHITKAEFDHGGTRHQSVQLSNADVFVMLTQDAMPADEFLLERLTAHLSGKVAVAYGRQLAREDAELPERISRQYNYPEKSCIKRLDHLSKYGIKTYFCSNVCAAYRRDLYEELGGFIRHTIFNEDMIYAAGAIQKGYEIAYEAQAKVIHSHNYSGMQQFHRNFDLAVSQAQHPEIFAKIKSESEGKKYVKRVTRELIRQRHPFQIPGFYTKCAFKYAGYLLGKNFQKLPKGFVIWASDNKDYWTRK